MWGLSEPTLVSDSFLVRVLISGRRGEGLDNVGYCRLQPASPTSTCQQLLHPVPSCPCHEESPASTHHHQHHHHYYYRQYGTAARHHSGTEALQHCKLLQSAWLRFNAINRRDREILYRAWTLSSLAVLTQVWMCNGKCQTTMLMLIHVDLW